MFEVIPNCSFNMWHSWIVLLNRDNTCVQKYWSSNTNFADIRSIYQHQHQYGYNINIGAPLMYIHISHDCKHKDMQNTTMGILIVSCTYWSVAHSNLNFIVSIKILNFWTYPPNFKEIGWISCKLWNFKSLFLPYICMVVTLHHTNIQMYGKIAFF